MKILCVLATALLMTLPLTGRAETVNRIAAVVNDEVITTYQLEKELAEQGVEKSPAARRQALEALIEETLISQRVEALGLKVTEEELEAAIEDVQRQNKLTREQLVEALRSQGMEFTEYRENLRRQILRFKLLGREVQAKVEVTSQEVRDYFRAHIDDYREAPNVRLNRLTFPIPPRASEEQMATIRQQAAEALARLRGGESFTSVLLA
ncbi:MAG: peptidyl-prolyl cis-trans isomerase, partial [Desulfuromonadales bacterium]|nr:peptidyl-prolyl cis-trans isomerase [Desulfuromonadales bacterium]